MENTFEVEKVLGKREKDGHIQYLLKWCGYSTRYNTWEPERNLECDELIAEFEQNRAECVLGEIILVIPFCWCVFARNRRVNYLLFT